MKVLSKRILSDENGRPVAVQRDHDEFLRFEKAVEKVEMESAYQRMMSFVGKVKWDEEPVEYQRRLRDEWDRATKAPSKVRQALDLTPTPP